MHACGNFVGKMLQTAVSQLFFFFQEATYIASRKTLLLCDLAQENQAQRGT